MFQSRCLGAKLMLVALLSWAIFPEMLTVDPKCNYYQNMNVGPTYYAYNREYPSNYGPNQDCLWVSVAPKGYIVEAECELQMPNFSGCTDDRILLSRDGEINLSNAEVFCGTRNITLQSYSNKISIGFQSSYMSQGGRFICSLQAKSDVSSQCDCGRKDLRRIVGGVETRVNEYPMMVGLVNLAKRELFCGATIIAHNYVVTAAHCFPIEISLLGVLVGDHDITLATDTNATILIRAAKYFIHPKYNPTTKLNDIAVVKTLTTIQYSLEIGPVCLPFTYYENSFSGEVVELLGWGTTEFTGPSSDKLLKTSVDVLDYSTCNKKINGTVDQLCTFRRDHDSCQKDSGGPALWYDYKTGRLFQLGIISYGYACATHYPAINTRITSYLLWIMSVTPGSEYCVKGLYN